jgi:hypothetical protein
MADKLVFCMTCGCTDGAHKASCGYRSGKPVRIVSWGRKPDLAAREKGRALRSALFRRIEELWLFRDALSGFQQTFLYSMKERVKTPGFFPSAKQAQVLDRIAEDLDRAQRLLRGEKESKVGLMALPFVPEQETRRRLRIGEEE